MYILKMEQKYEKTLFVFFISAFELGVANCHTSQEGHLSSTDNKFTNARKILHITKGDIFQVSFTQTYEEL